MVESFKPEERMEIAKHAIAPLAAQLQGHGVDVNAFANQFADARYATSGKGNISSQATLRFVQTVLTSHPEMADEMIRARTRNMSPDDQKLVNAAVERSGTSGYKKYAYAESVIAQTRQFSKEERGDILGIVKAGESFPAAVARERKELAAIAREGEAEKPKSADDLYREGERNVRDQVNKVRTEISNLSKYMDPLEQGMYEAHFARQVPAARAIEGYSGAASILGGVLRPMELKWALPKSWGGETGKEMLYKQGEAIVEGAEAMAGAGKEWQEAGAARDKYRAAMSRCKTAVANYERSYRGSGGICKRGEGTGHRDQRARQGCEGICRCGQADGGIQREDESRLRGSQVIRYDHWAGGRDGPGCQSGRPSYWACSRQGGPCRNDPGHCHGTGHRCSRGFGGQSDPHGH